jgi:monovalent cation:H+ antiporter, CPA1 family
MESILSILLGVVGLLVVIGFLPAVATRLALPQTVLLAVTGVAIGIGVHLTAGFSGGGGFSGDMLHAIGHLEIPAEAILYIFLPVLLFEASLAVDVRRLLDDIGPVLLLAIVAVVVSTLFVGLALAPVSGLPPSVALVTCLLVGAILATTDPGAVIGVFRDVGAPRRLTTLVEGESLLNDAAAIALSAILIAMLTGSRAPDFSTAVMDLLVQFVGGLAVGVLLARGFVLVMPLLRNIAAAEITLTLALAYLAFIVGQAYAQVSGVVAVVAAALVIGSSGRTRFSGQSWIGMRQVWEQLGFWSSSFLFVLAGMVVPPILMDVTWADIGRLAVVIVATLAARAVVIYGLLPILSWVGLAQKVGGGFKVVMLWGGLRGAVSVALAVAVAENPRIPEEVQRFVAVVATGYVLFTLLVQGTTLRVLMRLLRLDRLTPVEQAMRNRVLALSLAEVRDGMMAAARDYRVASATVGEAADYYTRRLAVVEADLAANDPLDQGDRQVFGLMILTNHEHELVLKRFADGLISRHMVQRAAVDIERMGDAARTGGLPSYMRATARTLKFGRGFRLALRIHDRFGVTRPLGVLLARRFEQLILMRSVLRDLKTFQKGRLAQLLGGEPAEVMGDLLEKRIADVEQQYDAFRLQYPDFAADLQRRYVLRRSLLREAEAYRTLHADGVINRDVAEDLTGDAITLERNLSRTPRMDLGLDRPALVARVPIFADLGAERQAKIAKVLRPRLAVPGQLLVRRGDRGDCMYFVSSGAVQVEVPGRPTPIRLGSGEFFGELALLYDQPRSADVRALGYCQLLVLDDKDFERLRRTDPEINAHIEAVAASRLGGWAPPATSAPATLPAAADPAAA